MFILLQHGVDAVVSDSVAVSGAKNVSDGQCACAEALAQFEDTLFEIDRVRCIELSSGCLQLVDLATVAVLFGELLYPSATDLDLFSDHPISMS